MQAANTLQLFAFIRADLASFKPKPKSPPPSEFEVGFSNHFADVPDPSSEPNFPKSLFLIRPLNSSYELNPVAREAQASVPVPEGLDLDSWIISPPKEESVDAVDGTINGTMKKKKGKGKEKSEKGVGKVKSRKKEKAVSLVDVESEEAADEKAERERVSHPNLITLR